MSRVLCALSGGVDSSVAALLLERAGHDVIGVFMRNGVAAGSTSRAKSCCSARDARDAARVADRLGIPFYPVDYGREFGSLIATFKREYRAGRTPSPCVLCNQDLKFGRLVELADAVGAGQVATGHYARIRDGAVLRPRDRSKDQTYFLFGIDPAVLPRLCFPLGDLTKDEVRALARAAGLGTADKEESMEVCFVPTGDYRDLLREDGPLRPGRFVDGAGRDLGPHAGFEAYTVGQRRGLPPLGRRHYVVELRPDRAEVVLGSRADLGRTDCRVGGIRWLVAPPAPGSTLACRVQIRARHDAAPARISVGADGSADVRFREPQRAVAPGQAAAFYDGPRLVGGGWIDGGRTVRGRPPADVRSRP